MFKKIDRLETVEAFIYTFITSKNEKCKEIFIPSAQIVSNSVATFYHDKPRNWHGDNDDGEFKETITPLTKITLSVDEVVKLVEVASARRQAENLLEQLNSSDFCKRFLVENDLAQSPPR